MRVIRQRAITALLALPAIYIWVARECALFRAGIPRGRMVSSDALQLLLLALLEAESRHGHELIKALQTHSNGFYSPSPGMVYPALTYLEALDYITAEHEGNRKRYSVSVVGHKFLTERRDRADRIFERLKEIGSKMDSVRCAFSGESVNKNAAEKSEDETDRYGWHRDLGEARRALKHMLVQMMGAPVKRQREEAAILKRTVAEISALDQGAILLCPARNRQTQTRTRKQTIYQLEPARERHLLWLLALTQFTLIMDFMVMMPLGPQIMTAFAIGTASFATAVSAFSWCAGLSGLFAATYIDRFDRRRLMLFMYALFALSNLACALAPSFGWLLVARAFAGIASGVIGSLVLTIIADVIPAERRGAATGTVMTAFSLAAVAGVPAGVLLGAQFGWASSFYLLALLSVLIWAACRKLVPPLREHLAATPTPLSQTLPALWHLGSQPNHLRAFLLTFTMMLSHMMVIPFIAPTLVANHGVRPDQLAWIYMAGGAATFFTSRAIGRLSDRYGKRLMFCLIGAVSIAPILFLTHLPNLTFVAILAFFPIFMVAMSGRIIPLQALLTTVPDPARRGAFMSLNSATQSLGTGCGAWLGGLILASTADGHITGYGTSGWIAVAIVVFGLFWVHAVKSASVADVPGDVGAKPA